MEYPVFLLLILICIGSGTCVVQHHDEVVKETDSRMNDESALQEELAGLEHEDDVTQKGNRTAISVVDRDCLEEFGSPVHCTHVGNVTRIERSSRLSLTEKVANKLANMIIEQIPSEIPDLNKKITVRVLEKIGRIKYNVPRDDDYVTSEAMEIGSAVGLGQGLIGAGVGAASVAGGVATAAGFFVFQVLKMTLDLQDVGGYGKMGTREEYLKIKEKFDEYIQDAFRNHDAKYPSQVGPLDKLSTKQFIANLNKEIKKLLNPTINEPVLDAMWYKIKEDIKDGKLTESGLNNLGKMKFYLSLVDINELLIKCMNSVCLQHGGKIIEREKSDSRCSYKDKASCESSYKYPLQQEDIYAEYKRKYKSCIHASYALRSICEDNHLQYDTDEGICRITQTYCEMKGAEWKYNDKIRRNDCIIPKVQDVFENIFGKTIVRGIKQIFDPRQYKPCHSNETDDGYFCRIVSCPEGEEQWANGGICYKKCKSGFHSFGCCICSPDCPKGWTDDGATCRKAGQCLSDQEHQGALCFTKCKEGYYGVGPVCWQRCPDGYHDKGAYCLRTGSIYAKKTRPASKKPCPKGLRDDGTSCWKDSYGRGAGRSPDKAPCPSGLSDDGTSCWSDAHIYGKGCCCTLWGCCNNCKKGYHDDGCTCRKVDVGIKISLFQRQRCKDNEERHLAFCYPKCKSGYHAVGCCLCQPNGGPRIVVSLGQRQYCADNEVNVLGVCWEKCKDGYTDDGALCRDSFTKKSYGRGTGTPDTQIKTKPQTSYGRGVGTTAIHIRAKERKIPFSTKNNK